jgi:hypothetical protein
MHVHVVGTGFEIPDPGICINLKPESGSATQWSESASCIIINILSSENSHEGGARGGADRGRWM